MLDVENKEYLSKRKKDHHPFKDWDKMFNLPFFKDLTNGWWGAQGSGYNFEFNRAGISFKVEQLGWPHAVVNFEGKNYLFSNLKQLDTFSIDKFEISIFDK